MSQRQKTRRTQQYLHPWRLTYLAVLEILQTASVQQAGFSVKTQSCDELVRYLHLLGTICDIKKHASYKKLPWIVREYLLE